MLFNGVASIIDNCLFIRLQYATNNQDNYMPVNKLHIVSILTMLIWYLVASDILVVHKKAII